MHERAYLEKKVTIFGCMRPYLLRLKFASAFNSRSSMF
jgi:hypothetical protein